MLITVDGIVIKQRVIGEANCYLDILTEEYGVVEVKAHGIRKITSKNAGSTSLFSYSTFCLNKNGSHYSLNSTEPKYNFHNLSQSIEALSLAVYFADIIKYCSASEQREEGILRFFAMALFKLEKGKISPLLIKSVFEFRLMTKIGFIPDLRACQDCICYESNEMYFLPDDGVIYCGECLTEKDDLLNHRRIMLSASLLYTMRFVAYCPLERVFNFKLAGKTETEFSQVAEEYLLIHLSRSFKSLDYFKNLFI